MKKKKTKNTRNEIILIPKAITTVKRYPRARKHTKFFKQNLGKPDFLHRSKRVILLAERKNKKKTLLYLLMKSI